MRELRSDAAIIGIGASAGGLPATQKILEGIDETFPVPVVLIEHTRGGEYSDLSVVFKRYSKIPAKEAEPGETAMAGNLYVAPGGYHLLIDSEGEFSLSVDEKVNWCRPAIDVFFDSLAVAYKERAVGIVLTGANRDGALGAGSLATAGAQVFVQDPKEAEFELMPKAALSVLKSTESYTLSEINSILCGFQKERNGL